MVRCEMRPDACTLRFRGWQFILLNLIGVLVWFAASTRVPLLKPAEAVRERQAEELMEQP